MVLPPTTDGCPSIIDRETSNADPDLSLYSRTASFASKTIVFTERDSTTPSASGPTPPTNAVPIISADGKTTYPPGYFSSRHLSIETLFYLATKGGAQVTSLEDRVGDFAVGKEFDALLVQTGQREVEEQKGEVGGAEQYDLALEEGLEDRFPAGEFGPNLFVEPEDSVEKVFEKFLFSVSECLPFVRLELALISSPFSRKGRRP